MVVWLVISSYRNDEDVMRILAQVRNCDQKLIDRILVIDSEGTGAIPKLIADGGWDDVVYRSYGWNLGSGANLCERLRIAAESGADYAYALNHDGCFDAGVLSTLLEAAKPVGRLGAAYPLSYLTSAGAYNLTGTRELPLPAKFSSLRPSKPLINVFWSSSNGALYSLEPVRRGIVPWTSMWMGWEDLEYGWRLSSHGYQQIIVCDAVYPDNYEYRKLWLGKVVDKPAWRTYYFARNLLFAIRRSRRRPLYYAVAAYRFLAEIALILMVRDGKRERIEYLFKGVMDGFKRPLDGLSELEYGELACKQAVPQSAEP